MFVVVCICTILHIAIGHITDEGCKTITKELTESFQSF